mmetsp:Transcript_19902/g.37965  ORF Transcript_19902/g.37965 Transcript_19902/m.37965 type:complete len:226 (+) Transcript_19902:427-1104(+)
MEPQNHLLGGRGEQEGDRGRAPAVGPCGRYHVRGLAAAVHTGHRQLRRGDSHMEHRQRRHQNEAVGSGRRQEDSDGALCGEGVVPAAAPGSAGVVRRGRMRALLGHGVQRRDAAGEAHGTRRRRGLPGDVRGPGEPVPRHGRRRGDREGVEHLSVRRAGLRQPSRDGLGAEPEVYLASAHPRPHLRGLRPPRRFHRHRLGRLQRVHVEHQRRARGQLRARHLDGG